VIEVIDLIQIILANKMQSFLKDCKEFEFLGWLTTTVLFDGLEMI